MKKLLLSIPVLLISVALHGQYVGIGTPTPTKPLHVVSNNPNVELARFQTNGGWSLISVGNGGAYSGLGHTGSKGWTGTWTAQDFAIQTGAIDRMFFQHSSGNIGIGMSNPQYNLDILGTSRVVGTHIVEGYLGIHTTNPLSRFHVYEDGTNDLMALFEGEGGSRKIQITNGLNSAILGSNTDYAYTGSDSPSDFAVMTNATPRMMISTDGYVGIGTTIPECKFNVVTDEQYSDVAIFRNNSGNSSVLVSNGTQSLLLNATPTLCTTGSVTSTDFALVSDGLTRLFIQNATGNIGIGTSSPQNKLHVAGNITATNGNFIGTISSAGESVSGNINVTGNATVTGQVTAGSLTVPNATVNGNLVNNGNTVVTGSITSGPVTAAALACTSADITGPLTGITGSFTGAVSCTNATINGTLNGQNATFNGSLLLGSTTISSTLTTMGNTTLSGTLAAGNTTINGTLISSGAATLNGFTSNANSTINGTLTVSSISEATPTNVNFQNSFSNYGGVFENVTYLKDKEGFVHLSGMVQIPNSYSDGTIFTLPAGCRPEKQNAYVIFKGGGIARLDINSGGNVILETGNSGIVSLSGISFRADH